MTTPTFTLASGELSAYALGCGYLQVSPEHANGDHVELRHDACFHVHVREYGVTMDADTRMPVWGPDPDHTPAPGYGAPKVRADWHVFDTLTEARRFYRAEVRRLARKHAG